MDREGDAYKLGGYDDNWKQRARAAGYAYGLKRVPYDNYPALLHEGESVLTKSQARLLNGAMPNIEINVNGAVIREESDIDKIATRLVEKIKEAKVGYVG